MKKHYVEFFSPGTFFEKSTIKGRKNTKFEDLEGCSICGRTSEKRDFKDKENGLTKADCKLSYCKNCGELKCGFCVDLGLCY